MVIITTIVVFSGNHELQLIREEDLISAAIGASPTPFEATNHVTENPPPYHRR